MNGHCGLAPALLKQSSLNKDNVLVSSEHYMLGSHPADCKYPNIASSLPSGSLPAQRSTADGFKPSNSGGDSEVSNASSNRSDSSMNIMDEGLINGSLEFEPYFQEGYYRASAVNECCDSGEAVADVDSNGNPCEREKSEEDGDNDDMLGGVFAFSEEGRRLSYYVLYDVTHFAIPIEFNKNSQLLLKSMCVLSFSSLSVFHSDMVLCLSVRDIDSRIFS